MARKTANKKIRKPKAFKKPKPIRKKKSSWLWAIVIALFILLFVRLFIFQTYVIQNSSMSGNLLPGDWVIIDKTVFGPRFPITIISLPFSPLITKTSSPKYYLKWPQLPYYRIPGLGYIKHNDVIAFNYPLEEYTPVDKKIVYVKRCIGLPGDTIQIKNNKVLINQKNVTIDNVLYEYKLNFKEKIIPEELLKKYGIDEGGPLNNYGEYFLYLSEEKAENLKSENSVISIKKNTKNYLVDNSVIFPHNPLSKWTLQNFGPLIIPKAGERISFSKNNIQFYSEILEKYEKCTVSIKHDSVYLNNLPLQSYFFKYDYYFVLDDNRDNGKDSREWGFLPVTNVIGKVSRVLISFDPSSKDFLKIRYNRIFKKL